MSDNPVKNPSPAQAQLAAMAWESSLTDVTALCNEGSDTKLAVSTVRAHALGDRVPDDAARAAYARIGIAPEDWPEPNRVGRPATRLEAVVAATQREEE